MQLAGDDIAQLAIVCRDIQSHHLEFRMVILQAIVRIAKTLLQHTGEARVGELKYHMRTHLIEGSSAQRCTTVDSILQSRASVPDLAMTSKIQDDCRRRD